jgi:hypothetical protein
MRTAAGLNPLFFRQDHLHIDPEEATLVSN